MARTSFASMARFRKAWSTRVHLPSANSGISSTTSRGLFPAVCGTRASSCRQRWQVEPPDYPTGSATSLHTHSKTSSGRAAFLERSRLETILARLRDKKNLILQGPPGTGKTWLAKKLAFALIGRKDDSRVRRLQFHPSLSYEDFIRGFRPSRRWCTQAH